MKAVVLVGSSHAFDEYGIQDGFEETLIELNDILDGFDSVVMIEIAGDTLAEILFEMPDFLVLVAFEYCDKDLDEMTQALTLINNHDDTRDIPSFMFMIQHQDTRSDEESEGVDTKLLTLASLDFEPGDTKSRN
jgi:hypothetical protein